MTITTDLDPWWAAKKSYDDANAAKAEFQRIMGQIDRSMDDLAAMNLAGKFNALPASVKQEFEAAWFALATVRDTLKADAGFMEALNWTP